VKHLDEETIQRLLHGEIDPPSEAASRAHVAVCAQCRERLREAEREEEKVLALLGRLDRRPVVVDAEALTARARGRSLRARGRAPGWQRRAAVVVLAMGAAGAAFAAPGSPLPRWVDRAAAWFRSEGADPVAEAGTAPESAGIAVPPTERFTIELEAGTGAASVRVTEGPDIVVRAAGGAARFVSDVDRLTVESGGSATDFEIELPRDAPRVEILAGGRRVFLKEGARIATDAPRDAGGEYRIDLGPPSVE
jgi:anti-sigma factor RsiW